MRVCQPSPLALKCAITSGDSLMPTRTLVTSALGRPRGVNKDCARSGLKSWVSTSLVGLALASLLTSGRNYKCRRVGFCICSWCLTYLMLALRRAITQSKKRFGPFRCVSNNENLLHEAHDMSLKVITMTIYGIKNTNFNEFERIWFIEPIVGCGHALKAGAGQWLSRQHPMVVTEKNQ